MESLAVLLVKAFNEKSAEYWDLRQKVYDLKNANDPSTNDVYKAILNSSYEAWRSLWIEKGERFTQIWGFQQFTGSNQYAAFCELILIGYQLYGSPDVGSNPASPNRVYSLEQILFGEQLNWQSRKNFLSTFLVHILQEIRPTV